MPTTSAGSAGCTPTRPAHPQAVVQLHTGSANAALTRPSMGAWLLYGLGTENQDLPGYVTINPPPNFGGAVNYGSAFLPAHFQGTRIISITGICRISSPPRPRRCSGGSSISIQR